MVKKVWENRGATGFRYLVFTKEAEDSSNFDESILPFLICPKTGKDLFYDKDITDYFFPNNEVFFHYLLDKNKLDWFNLPEKWHKINYGLEDSEITDEYKECKMIHLISKKFDKLWKILDNNVEK